MVPKEQLVLKDLLAVLQVLQENPEQLVPKVI